MADMAAVLGCRPFIGDTQRLNPTNALSEGGDIANLTN